MIHSLRKLFRQDVKLIFRPEYFLGFGDVPFDNIIDPYRYKKIRDALIRQKFAKYRDFMAPPKILDQQMKNVHSDAYIQKLKDPQSAGKALGLPHVDPWDDHILEFYKAISGGTIFGLKEAFRQPLKPVFNLGGGFHHAQWEKAEGFCLINDVAAAVRSMRKKYPYLRVLIVDLDYHQGNGNLLLLKDDPNSFFFSMQSLNWVDCQKHENMEIILPDKCGDDDYLNALNNNFPDYFTRVSPEAIIYLAGADPHINDTLCDFEVSEEALLERDLLIYNMAQEKNIPFLALPAGGYGPDSWKIYFNFIKAVILKRREL
jgi:acetoin utilization deacetylase AcuC-like enzyme